MSSPHKHQQHQNKLRNMRAAHQAHSHRSTTPSVPTTHHLSLPQLARQAAAASLSSLLLLTAQPCAAQEELSIAFPASGRPDIRAAQKTLVEAWGG